MKLLTRLRSPSQLQQTPPITVILNEISSNVSDEESEHLGVGAAMVPDVIGMEFLDGSRRRIPDIHEEFPPHGLAYDDYAEELES